jgi:hypothetical protein
MASNQSVAEMRERARRGRLCRSASVRRGRHSEARTRPKGEQKKAKKITKEKLAKQCGIACERLATNNSAEAEVVRRNENTRQNNTGQGNDTTRIQSEYKACGQRSQGQADRKKEMHIQTDSPMHSNKQMNTLQVLILLVDQCTETVRCRQGQSQSQSQSKSKREQHERQYTDHLWVKHQRIVCVCMWIVVTIQRRGDNPTRLCKTIGLGKRERERERKN